MAGLFLASLISKRLLGFTGEMAGQRTERMAIEQQTEADPEDLYYQAALPSLTAERQTAQNALLQTILGGRGMEMQVPGERRI
jgi:hypothetical protein